MRKPCCDKQDTNKGAWSKQEDQKLIDYIRTHGEGCWRSLPKAAATVTSKHAVSNAKVISADNDRVSDAGSCLEDETSGDSNLNLDLTISVPSLSSTPVDEDNNKPQNNVSIVAGAIGSDELPTLLLFR
ncbi:hypothetical protein Patl1_21317 [Pistacia atlantica]|uniref:Uncharacterized protein n=1 Tax=Pistacia atlantica TaxID=434234 RepID=A0ACC1BKJ5_9ROSI|nr:hypothetical protein Patl1_21317 [Pistacia atlantica]